MPQLDTIYILGCLWKGPEEIYLGPTQQFTLEDIPLENPSEKGILGRISGLQKVYKLDTGHVVCCCSDEGALSTST